jgi:hypothetical protein
LTPLPLEVSRDGCALRPSRVAVRVAAHDRA